MRMADAAAQGAVSAGTRTKPIRANLFIEKGVDGRPKLLGSRCRQTATLFWPAEVMNPNTHVEGTMEPAEIDGHGRLISFTTVARGLPGFPSPYTLGVIALDAGPSLIAQIEFDTGEPPSLGCRVELVIGTIKSEKDGTAIVGPKFRTIGA